MNIEDIPCYSRIAEKEEFRPQFCYDVDCHFCDDPYCCTIPHLIEHLKNIEHEE